MTVASSLHPLNRALARVETVPSLFGLCPYVVVKDGRRVRLSPWRTLYTCLLIVALVAYLVFRIYLGKTGNSNTDYEWKISMMKLLVHCISSIVSLICSMTTTEVRGDALDMLLTSEITGTTAVITLKFDLMFKFVIVLNLVLDTITFNNLAYISISWGFYLASMINAACVEHFVGFLYVLKDAYYQMEQWIVEPARPRIESALSSFERVTAAAEYQNETFGLQLLLIVGANFLLSTTNAFLIVTETNIPKKLMSVLWCGSAAVFPLRIVYVIDKLLQQRRQFNDTLNTLLVRRQIFYTPSETEKVNLHIAMKKELEFTARGFFTLDYGLINSMLGAVTTYLVILMQFNQT